MSFQPNFFSSRVWGLLSAFLIFVTGFVLLVFPTRLSRNLTRSSYDWSFSLPGLPKRDLSAAEVVIIYIDEDSLKELNGSLDKPMKRSIHARLLDRLKEEGARAVVMDIVFSDAGDEGEDRKFADALRSNGTVVLGVDYNPVEDNDTAGISVVRRLTPPYSLFEEAAAKNGLVVLHPEEDFLIRQHLHHLDDVPDGPPSLSWCAGQVIGLKLMNDPAQLSVRRWINYYGPPGAIPHVSYKQAYYPNRLPPGYFRNKVVFVGARPITAKFMEKRDELRSPYPARGKEFSFMPMVEIHATEFLNLIRGDSLLRTSASIEIGVVALVALLFGFGLLQTQPLRATFWAILGVILVTLLVELVFVNYHIWFAWLIIVVIQIPFALFCAILFRSLEWYVQRRRHEEERRRSDLQIREQAALLDKAQDAIIVHDLNWKTNYWNRGAERLYGWSFEEVQEKDLRAEIFKEDELKALGALEAAMSKGEWSGEFRQTNKQGKKLIVQSRWTLVRDQDGQPKSVFVINTDVTDAKSLESQFLRTQRMESIGTLAGGIAHDLNNVLAPIVLGVELLKMKATDEFTKKTLTTMASSAKRGSDMVKQVLIFSRGHEGDKTVIQISHLIKEMQKIIQETFPKTITVQAAIGEQLSPVLGDATQIHQIILNLCVNARDAMPEGGNIAIEAGNVIVSESEANKFIGAKPGNHVLLSVKDSGTGIPPEIINKIFEPFFTTKEIGKGTGLGLSTVISIIKSHGGFLDLKSEVGQGTSFNVYLPAVDATVSQLQSSPLQGLRGNGQTIMIIDDEPAILDLAKSILGHYGYNIITAHHGADALALYPQFKEKIKLVVTDMMMPVMDGFNVIKALKSQSPHLKFIAISGLMQGDTIKEKLGEDIVFIPKPFNVEKLLKALHEMLA